MTVLLLVAKELQDIFSEKVNLTVGIWVNGPAKVKPRYNYRHFNQKWT